MNADAFMALCKEAETPPHLSTPCIEYNKGRNPTRRGGKRDYPKLQVDKRRVRTHRLSYELHYGIIPAGLFVLHHCDNPWCVSPAHLYLGDLRQNNKDTKDRGRTTKGRRNPYKSKEPLRKLSPEQVRLIRTLSASLSQRKIAEQLSVPRSQVRLVLEGKTYLDIE